MHHGSAIRKEFLMEDFLKKALDREGRISYIGN
jgi:hypothetical protein